MKSTGKLVYSPYSHLGSSKDWAVVMCDDEISRYYRYLYTKEYPYLNSGRSVKLTRPVFGAHISIVRNERVQSKYWRLDEGKIISFEYEDGVMDNKMYYWMRINCPFLLDLRERMGLLRNPKYGLHMTIGIATKI